MIMKRKKGKKKKEEEKKAQISICGYPTNELPGNLQDAMREKGVGNDTGMMRLKRTKS